ncbi:MAG: hypothetical protein ACJ8J0_06750 [Longimicrobiaceae bacterium]
MRASGAAGTASAASPRRRIYLINALKPDGTTDPREVRRSVEAARAKTPGAALFVLLDERNPEAVRAARHAGATHFLGAAVASNPEALHWRVSEVLGPRTVGRGPVARGMVRRTLSGGGSHQGAVERSGFGGGRGSHAPAMAPRLELTPLVEPSSAEVEAARRRVARELPRLPSAAESLARAAALVSVHAPELRDPASGRFDARRIAERLGVSISRLAGVVGVSQQALSARPDSPGAQAGLLPIARVIAALDELLPVERVRMWLHSPHSRFGGATPLAKILEGEAEPLARMVEGALEGIPD